MRTTDYFLLASLIALMFWGLVNTYVQKKWHLFALFVGKKHAFRVHATIIGFAFAEFVIGLLVGSTSSWRFANFSAAGVPLIIYGTWYFYKSIRLYGTSAMTHSYVFKGKKPHSTSTSNVYIDPYAVSYTLILAGFGLSSGRYTFLICAASMLPYFWLLNFIEKA